MESISPSVVRSYHFGDRIDLMSTSASRTNYILSHMTEFFPHAAVWKASVAHELPSSHGLQSRIEHLEFDSAFGRHSLEEALHHRGGLVHGLVVLHQGRIVLERYIGVEPAGRHAVMSVTKPMVGACVSILAAEGKIDVRQTIETYMPDLKGSAWESTKVQDVLDMCSGMDGLEDTPGAFSDHNHPVHQYESAMGTLGVIGAAGSVFDVVRGMPRRAPAGLRYEYNSVNSFVLAWLIEEVAAMPFPQFLSERIWSRIGTESDAMCYISPHGGSSGDGGVSCCLRDLARYGLAYTPIGRRLLGEVIPVAHVNAIQTTGRRDVYSAGEGSAELAAEDPPIFNSLHWDKVWADGDFFKAGWAGQGLHVSPARELVIAFFGKLGKDTSDRNSLPRFARHLSRNIDQVLQ